MINTAILLHMMFFLSIAIELLRVEEFDFQIVRPLTRRSCDEAAAKCRAR
jgi:hypothetical protein